MTRVPLADALVDLLSMADGPAPAGLRIRDLDIDVPMEVAIAQVDGVPTLLAHPRRWRHFTAFDVLPSRMRVRAGTTECREIAGEVAR